MDLIPHDRVALCHLCGLPDTAEVPGEVLEQYRRVRKLLSRLGASGPLSVPALLAIGMSAGLGCEQEEPEEVTLRTLYAKGEVKKNDPIQVEWRGEQREALFLGFRSDGRVEFLLDSDRRPHTTTLDKAKALEAVA